VEEFLNLPKTDQADILRAKAPELGMSPEALEKDIYVCRALSLLFDIPNIPQMAFKGGTSLSKVYRAIERFSEDIDVTVDHNGLIPGEDPFQTGYSRTKKDKLIAKLRAALLDLLKDKIAPALNHRVTSGENIELNEGNSTVMLNYSSSLSNKLDYIKQRVQIEFGAINSTEPREKRRIQSYIGEVLPNLMFPEAEVQVLKGTRTFWEKVTLIHAEINRDRKLGGFDRFSRHWYDLYRMADHEIGKDALSRDFGLLEDVVKYKMTFYRSGGAKYEDCLSRNVRLIPEGKLRQALEKDYQKMKEAGMFYGVAPIFTGIIERITNLEREINAVLVMR
jgi:hypothetical protein